MTRWYLEGFTEPARGKSRLPVAPLPFTVGRLDGLPLTLHSAEVSRRHAQITEAAERLVVQDLGSTNGTFVNRARISQPTVISDGDILHFGDLEFRVVDEMAGQIEEEDASEMTMVKQVTLSTRLAMGTRELREMIEQEMVTAVFQPIVRAGGALFAYEALGRGAHPALPPSPLPLFKIAEDIGQSIALSRAFRVVALREMQRLQVREPLYLNTHPDEVKDAKLLLDDFRQLRSRFPTINMVMEMHESAVTDIALMRDIQRELKLLQIGLAYDDFGAGQARLLELAHAPPEVVKFDIAFVRGIDKAPPQQVQLVSALAGMVRNMGVMSLAEGVGEAPEAAVCETLPFDLFQGYHYARPDALERFVKR